MEPVGTPALPALRRRLASVRDAAREVTREVARQPQPGVAGEPVADPPAPTGWVGDCAAYDRHGRRPGRLELTDAAAAAHGDSFVWIGMQEPADADFAVVSEQFHLPPLAVEDAVRAHQRPKLEVYGDLVFAVLKPVRYVDSDEVVDVSELAVFLGAKFIITVRHGMSDVLGAVRQELDAAGSKLLAHGPTAVLYRAADLIVDEYEQVAESIGVDVDEIETEVFSGDNSDHAQRIYKLKREVIEFRRAVLPLVHPLQRLAESQVPMVEQSAAPYFRDVHDHLLRAADAIEAQDRMLTDVLSADLAQVSIRQSNTAVRQNEDMRKISAWAAIALVPTAIAGIYGMNFDNMPELHWHYGYFIVLGVVLAACTGLYVAFRRNDWL